MLLLGTIGAAFVTLSSTEINTAAIFATGSCPIFGRSRSQAGDVGAKHRFQLGAFAFTIGRKLGVAPTAGRYEIAVTDTGGGGRTVTATGIVNKARRQVVLKLVVGASAPQFVPAGDLFRNKSYGWQQR